MTSQPTTPSPQAEPAKPSSGPLGPNPIQAALAKVMDRKHLRADEAEAVMTQIMAGEATEAQIGGYLTALRMKGETVPEISGSARAMRSASVAHCGSISENCTPGRLVAMAPNSPRTADGPSGFGSNVSCCGWPPCRYSMIIRRARPNV